MKQIAGSRKIEVVLVPIINAHKRTHQRGIAGGSLARARKTRRVGGQEGKQNPQDQQRFKNCHTRKDIDERAGSQQHNRGKRERAL